MDRTSWKDSKFERTDKLLYLDHNECCDNVMVQHIDLFLKGLNSETLIKYPNLRKAYLSLNKLGFNPDITLLTSGAEDAIRVIIDLYKDMEWLTKPSISFPDPTFGMLPVFAEIYDLTPIPVRYNDSFMYNVEELLKGDIIYLAYPDNTTGTLLDIISLNRLLYSGKIIILDETYYEFAGTSTIELIDRFPNLYVVRSFSKAFGVAGIRIGMVVSNKRNISKLINNKPAYEINSVACEYLDFIQNEDMLSSVNRVKDGKGLIEKELIRLGYKVKDTHANFVLVEYDSTLFNSITKFAQIKVIEISSKKYIRITAPDRLTAEVLIKCLIQ